MKDFPEEMQGDICVHLNKDVLALNLFKPASQGCLKVLQCYSVFLKHPAVLL